MRAKLFHSNTYHHNFLQIASSCHRRHRCQQMPVGNCGVCGGDESKLQREKEEKTLTAYLLRTAYTAIHLSARQAATHHHRSVKYRKFLHLMPVRYGK